LVSPTAEIMNRLIDCWERASARTGALLVASVEREIQDLSNYWSAGRRAEAIPTGEQVLADSARLLGPEHPTP
jgi:hypothetical protein